MNDKDFDKLFSDKLNEEGNYPHKEKVKRQVFTRLDGTNSFAYNGLWTLLFLLAAFSAYQTWRVNQVEKMNESFKTPAQKENILKSSVIKYDTVYKTTVVYKTDTIVKKVYVVEKVLSENRQHTKPGYTEKGIGNRTTKLVQTDNSPTPSVFEAQNKPSKPDVCPQNTIVEQTPNKNNTGLNKSDETKVDNGKGKNEENTPNTLAVNEPQNRGYNNAQNGVKPTKDTLKNTSLDTKDATLNEWAKLKEPLKDSIFQKETINVVEDMNKPITQPVAVKNFGIGIHGGGAILLPTVRGIDLGLLAGVNGEYTFRNKLRFQIYADYGDISFKVSDNLKTLNLPEIQSPNSQHTFKYVEGHQESLFLGFNINYIFKSKGWLRPFASAGYMYQTSPETNARYIFTHNSTGQELSLFSHQHYSDKHYGMIGLGLEMSLYKNFTSRISVDYGINLQEDHKQIKGGIFIPKGGVFYNF